MKQGWSSFMDRRVKERLVGATILVVLVVLIVPELLSGPKRALVPQAPATAEPLRSVTVDLATNKATAATEEAASAVSPNDMPGATGSGVAPGTNPGTTAGTAERADRDAGTSSELATPAPSGPGRAPGVTAPPSQGQPPATQPLDSGAAPKSGQAGASAEAAHHGWAAQLGSFAARANAEKLERQLRTQGFSPFLAATGSGRALRYRVRVGPLADRAATEKVIARLHRAGHSASVVAP